MSDSNEKGMAVEAETAFGKYKIKGTDVNNLLTILIFAGVLLLIYAMWAHTGDARDANIAFVSAVKEQTVAVKDQTIAAREQNCLLRFPPEVREQRVDFCRQVAR